MSPTHKTTKALKLWVNTGELSGDLQAATMLKALKEQHPHVELCGMGGPYLATIGQKAMARIESLSVMGILEVFTAIPRALYILRNIKKALQKEQPDAVLLVDAPEFNFRVARIAHDLGIPVYYFIPPKVWAWRAGRVRFLQDFVTRILCILPFEKDFYAKHGMDVDYGGNPLVDLVNYPAIKHITPIAGRIGIMPGSRKKEIETLMPLYADLATLLHAEHPQLDYHCIRASTIPEKKLRALWTSSVPLHIHEPENRYAFMRSCQCMLAASGTATLETALAGVPTLVSYKVSPISLWLVRRFIRVEFAALPNIIMGRAIFPEFLQTDATPERLAKELRLWLKDPAILKKVHDDMDIVRQHCGELGSAQRTAAYLLAALRDAKIGNIPPII